MMRSVEPGDPALVAADPGLPGLLEVLQPARLLERLGWDYYTVEVRYLRYKPATSVVAGLVLTGADGRADMLQAFAFGAGAEDKLAKLRASGRCDDVGRGVGIVGELAAGLADATADRHLPGIRRFLRGGARVRPLVYKPGRRWVAHQPAPDGPGKLVKVHRPGAVEGLRLRHRAAQGLPVPELLRYSSRGAVTSVWVPGTPLDEAHRAAPEQRAGLWRDAGELLARVHAVAPLPGLKATPRAHHLATAVHALEALAPLHVPQAVAVAERVTAELGAWRPVVTHGDFSADQVVVRSSGDLVLLDLDRLGLDDPHADLGSWFAAALVAGDLEGIAELEPLLEGYEAGGGRVDGARLRAHCAGGVLQRATEPFRRRLAGWPEEIDRLVAVARTLSQGRDR